MGHVSGARGWEGKEAEDGTTWLIGGRVGAQVTSSGGEIVFEGYVVLSRRHRR